ncbi:GNAT family protein [Sporosarcina sp.]|uniref:GNAT family N-acetyltransferase n=1 Tax=Sporosarcina sp. TaxID=49982 RepID=UPI00262EEF30|nr:GNAT family protein [Sporosarcina sp.]
MNILDDLPELETERLLLRKITSADTADIFSYSSNENVSKYVTWGKHQSIEDTEKFIDFILKGYEYFNKALWGIVLKDTGQLIGTIDFVSMNKNHQSAEIGYVLSEPFWGKGITTEAAKRIIEFGFTELELERIQARCIAENTGSHKVMEKSGMTYEGTMRKGFLSDGRFHDLKFFSILREEQKRTR